MFENIQNRFNGLFGKVEPGKCRVTMNGKIAVKCSNGDYKTYNVKKRRLTNVSNFCFNVGEEMFFIVPTTKAKVGDILLIGGKPKCVIKVENEGESLKVIDYENSEIREVIPERHVFMGSTYFYGKIVSMFGDTLKKGNGFGNFIKMSMISQMLGGSNNGGSNNSGSNMFSGGLGQMMAMSMLMNGKVENPLEGIFDFDLGIDTDMNINAFDEDDDDEEENEEEEEPVPAKPKAKKTKKSKEV